MIRREHRGERSEVCLITIGRPEKANALDVAHWRALADEVRAGSDDGARAIVITGEGRTFCAGADLAEPDYNALLESCEDCMQAIVSVPAPVIAHVNGPAIGAGLQLAVSCDLRIGEPTARFAIPAAAISRPAHPTLIQRIAAVAGTSAARAMLIGGEQIESDRAHQLGLLDRIADLSSTLDWAHRIAGYAPLVVEFFKRELTVADDEGTKRYTEFLETLLASADFAEATRAHAEGRSPRYLGE